MPEEKERVRRLFAAIVIVLAFPMGAAHSRHGHTFRVEYKAPVRGAEGVFTLDVIFSYRPTAADANRILREQIVRILKRHVPDGDILANCWYSPTGDEIDEDLITLPDGSQHLIYWRKLGKVVTFNEYERRKGR